MEAIMPRVIFDSNIEHPNQRDRPRSLHIQVSRASITNVRSLEHSSRADLAKCVDTFQLGSLFYGADFPACPSDVHVVTDKFLKHIAGTDNVRKAPQLSVNSVPDMERSLQRDMLWTEAKDIWCVSLEPVWGDFMGAPAVGPTRPVPFLDAVPLTLWVHVPPLGGTSVDIHALAHVANLVSMQLNHYQYLFLLRLSEQASELATVLALDSNRILCQEQGSSVVLGAMVPQVEVTFVMPSQSPGKECSGGDLESVLPDSASLQEDNIPTSVPGMPNTPQGPRRPGVHTPGSEMSSISMDFPPEPIVPLPSVVAFSGLAIPNNLNAGLSSVKKGLSSFMTSLDSALKPGLDDASDTVSLRSDASSDSENYVVVNMSADGSGDRNTECLDAMFRVAPAAIEPLQVLEVASEVLEEEGTATTSPSERSLDSSSKRRDLVSMSTFKLGQVELVQQSQGYSSIIKLQVANLVAEECGSIPWDEFQSKFGCRSRAWLEVPVDSGGHTRAKVRLTHTVRPGELTDRNSIQDWSEDYLEARISDVNLELNMSTVVGLADLAEDEVIPQPLPMQLSLENVHLQLNEDRPPANITSPGAIPIHLAVARLLVNRGEDGVFCVEPHSRPDMDHSIDNGVRQLAILEHTNKQLQVENAELKRRLSALERVSEENHLLRQSSEESQILRSVLAVAQDDLAGLLEEKQSLLDRLRSLQEQLDQTQRSKR